MPMLNLGCGTVTLPAPRPLHHALVDEDIYTHPDWHNVDRNAAPGVDETVDVFTYPWPWPDNSFDGALASHLVEHIPHAPNIPALNGNPNGAYMHCGSYWQQNVIEWRRRAEYLATLQDGWFVFFAELHRVLKPDAVAHILVPHAHSDGAMGDPTHTRYVMPHTFGYFDADGGTFRYSIGSAWQMQGEVRYRITEMFYHLLPATGDDPEIAARKERDLQMAIMTRINVVYEFYVRLKAVKDASDHE